jgi:hypothetical protein
LPSRGAAILVDLKPMADGHLRSLWSQNIFHHWATSNPPVITIENQKNMNGSVIRNRTNWRDWAMGVIGRDKSDIVVQPEFFIEWYIPRSWQIRNWCSHEKFSNILELAHRKTSIWFTQPKLTKLRKGREGDQMKRIHARKVLPLGEGKRDCYDVRRLKSHNIPRWQSDVVQTNWASHSKVTIVPCLLLVGQIHHAWLEFRFIDPWHFWSSLGNKGQIKDESKSTLNTILIMWERVVWFQNVSMKNALKVHLTSAQGSVFPHDLVHRMASPPSSFVID